ncbi:MAG: Gfo/Idh/MocA family oxidoreductase [bacterium]
MSKLKIGVIGLGFMGRMHAALFKELPQTQLVAVSDLDPGRYDGDIFEGATFHADFRELLQRGDIDAVSICVSDKAHCEPAVLAARAGKHIFLEKPIALDLAEAHRIVEETRKANVMLMIGFLLRFDPRYAGVKDLLDKGRIGDIIHIHARRNSPKSEGPARYMGSTPLVFHVTIHDIDLVLWYLGQKVKTVYAQAVSKALRENKMDDTMFAIIRFESGALVSLESSWALPEGSATKLDACMEILGTTGMARVECGCGGLWFCDSASTAFPDTMHWPSVRNHVAGDLKEELAHFANCVISGTQPLVTGSDGIRSLELACAIQRSMDTGEVVTV